MLINNGLHIFIKVFLLSVISWNVLKVLNSLAYYIYIYQILLVMDFSNGLLQVFFKSSAPVSIRYYNTNKYD